MPKNLTHILKIKGPLLSSDLCNYLCAEGNITRIAATKQISRAIATETVSSLRGLFPRREAFIYLPEQFGSPTYWQILTSTLQKTQSAYGYAIGALLARGGVMPLAHFPAASGSPHFMSKRLSHEAVLQRLCSNGLVKKIDLLGIGECVALRESNEEYFNGVEIEVKARMVTESVLLKAVAQWSKNLGLVSYEQLKNRDVSEPKVTGFLFDLTAPSYLTGLLQQKSSGGTMPGFFCCDVLFNGKLEEEHIAPFINKCRSIKSLPKTGRPFFIFVADSYSKEAFLALKEQGIVPATVNNLFGQETAETLRALTETLKSITFLNNKSEQIDEVMTRLSHIEGAASQLRGDLFEYIVAKAVKDSAQYVEVGVQCKDSKGKKADCDVFVSNGYKKVTFIECKGYNPYAEVLHKDVKHWIHEQVPVFFKHALIHYPNTAIHVEFWTTGKLGKDSMDLLNDFKEKNKNDQRYEVVFRQAHDVKDFIDGTRNKSLVRVFGKHFIDYYRKDPLGAVTPPKRLASSDNVPT